MKTIKKSVFYSAVLTSITLVGCIFEGIIQPIMLESLHLSAGSIHAGEYNAFVSPSSPGTPVILSDFGLEVNVDNWTEAGEDVDEANRFESENNIAEIVITSDSVIMVTEDSVYAPGIDLTALFMTDRVGRSRFEPRFTVEHLIGKKITFEPMILQLVSTLERDLDQTFLIDITMDDGQTFALKSNRVQVARE